MKRREIIEGEIGRYEYPGIGIIHTEDCEVALKGVLPGQKVRCRIRKAGKTKCDAMLLEILEPSSIEGESRCPHYPECGGCQLQTVPVEEQMAIKSEQIRTLLEDVLEDPEEGWFEGIVPSPAEEGYRNKMEFTFGDPFKDGPMVLGMHKKGSFYDIVDVPECRIVDADIRKIRTAVLQLASETTYPYYHRLTHRGFYRHLLVRKARATGQILVDLVTTTQFQPEMTMEELDRRLVETLTALPLTGTVTGILHTCNDSVADTIHNDKTVILYGTDRIVEKLLGMEFEITPFSFFQTNSGGAEVLYDKVRTYIGDTKDKVIYDLYSGTGTIAQILAPVAKHVTGVEIVEEAVTAAWENARRNHLENCNFICGDVMKVVGSLPEKPDLIVLDPPREGIHPKAMPGILKFGADRIVYISCKATSLKRDLVPLQLAGYRVKKVSLIDLFPGTLHCEVIALMSREKG